jgi:two-component system, response regulator PdtaR
MGSVGKRTVCVVEDEPITRMDAVLLLEEAGYEVKEFAVVEKAIAFLETKAPAVVFVFTDVHTPGRLDGVALAHVANDRWPWIKILITSGTISEMEARIPPGSAFLRKPWRPSEVLAHAEMALRH